MRLRFLGEGVISHGRVSTQRRGWGGMGAAL